MLSHALFVAIKYDCVLFELYFHNMMLVNLAFTICFAEQYFMSRMLGLYLYTLIISHKSSNMLRILHKLTLYKELQTFVTNNVFLTKTVKTQQQNKEPNIKTLAGAGD